MSRNNRQRTQNRNIDGTLELFKLFAIATLLTLNSNTTQSEDGQVSGWDMAAVSSNLVLLGSTAIQLITRAVMACNRTAISQPSVDLETAMLPSQQDSSALKQREGAIYSCKQTAPRNTQVVLSSFSNAALTAAAGSGFSMIAMFGRSFFNMQDSDRATYLSLLLPGITLLGFSQCFESAQHHSRQANFASIASGVTAAIALLTAFINIAAPSDLFSNQMTAEAQSMRIADATLSSFFALSAALTGISLCCYHPATEETDSTTQQATTRSPHSP